MSLTTKIFLTLNVLAVVYFAFQAGRHYEASRRLKEERK